LVHDGFPGPRLAKSSLGDGHAALECEPGLAPVVLAGAGPAVVNAG